MFAILSIESQADARNVLVLHSYHQGLEWTDRISAGIQSVLNNKDANIEIHYEYLDTKRNPGEDYYRRLIQFEKEKTKLSSINFQVIIVSDNNALRFVVDHGDLLFPGVPVVFCGVNNFNRSMLKGMTNITGVVELIDYEATLDIMMKLHPDQDRILVVVDKTPTGIAIKSEFQKIESRFSPRIKFEFFQDFILGEVEEKIAQIESSYLIYLLTFNRDRNQNFISYSDGIQMIHRASKVPIYGSWDFYFGKGIVGGMITSGFFQGQKAAQLAMRIIKGESAQTIPIVDKSPNKFMFDYNQMVRFNIRRRDLPQGSYIINEPPGLIDRHKQSVFILLGIILAVVFVLGWRLLIQKRRQELLERNTRELDRRVKEQTTELLQKNDLLQKEVAERQEAEKNLQDKTQKLEQAISDVKKLSGLLPICSSCKKIRDDQGYWNQIESYIHEHSEATFTHSICPKCAKALYPELDL